MALKSASIKNSPIEVLFLILVFLIPLFYSAATHELFEFPKMFLVYFITLAITGVLLFKTISQKKIKIVRTDLDKAIFIFLLSYFLSTLFSMDLYTSFFGYYSRFNGGLLSVVGFIALHYVFRSTLKDNPKFIRSVVSTLLFSAFLVAVFGVAQHFGYQKGQWVQDSAARVFASLGQPNWLAAFLTMVFPLSLAILTVKPMGKIETAGMLIITVIIYTAFWFTYSLSGLLGLGVGIACFLITCAKQLTSQRWGLLLFSFFLCFLVSILQPGIFSARLESLFKQIHASAFAVYAAGENVPVEYEGDTLKIRFIVWQGALNLLRREPKALLIGTGPETFAYSFLPYRPAELNLTSEWDFLYNKAHNDYIDIWVDRGTLGLLAYFLLIVSVTLSFVKTHSKNPKIKILQTSFYSGWLGLLVTNFLGWSVVPTSLLFWLFPVFITAAEDYFSNKTLPYTVIAPARLWREPPEADEAISTDYLRGQGLSQSLGKPGICYRRLRLLRNNTMRNSNLLPKLMLIFIFSAAFIVLISFFLADVFLTKGLSARRFGNYLAAEKGLRLATRLNPLEPIYRREYAALLADLAGKGAVISDDKDVQEQAQRWATEAGKEAALAIKLNPRNSLTLKALLKTYYALSLYYPPFEEITENIGETLIAISSTEAHVRYSVSLVYAGYGKEEQALKLISEALELKPNYREALVLRETLLKNN